MSSISRLLRETIQLYRSHLSLLSGYLAWLLLPFAGYVLLTFVPNEEVEIIAGFFLLLIEIVLWVWMSIFLVQLINDLHDKKNKNAIDHNALQRETWKLLLPLLGVALLTFLTVIGGLILLIIPGLVFVIWFGFTQLSVILEGKRGMNALLFSRSLVRGRFFKAAAYMLTGPILIVFTYSVFLSAIIFLIAAGDLSMVEQIANEDPPLWLIILDTLVQTFLIAPLSLIYSLLVFKQFRQTSTPSKKRDEAKEL